MDNVLIEGLTPALVDAFLVIVSAVIAWVGNEARKSQKANANNGNFTFLTRVAEVAVQSAEQLFGEFAGEQKKAYALDLVEKRLAELGIKVDTEAIEAQIEAAVLREFNYPDATTLPTESTTEEGDVSTGTIKVETPVVGPDEA